jgi:hypothetical protein
LFSSFPRKINDKVVYSLSEAVDLINQLNGRKTIYISLYQHRIVRDNDLIPGSAVIDKVLGEVSSIKEARILHERLTNLGVRHYITYTTKSFNFYILLKAEDQEEIIGEFVKWRKKKIDPFIKFDPRLEINPGKMVILPNTMVMETRRYCIPLLYQELYLDQEELEELSTTRRGKLHLPEAEKLRPLSL